MQLIPNQLIELHVEGHNGLEIYRTRVEDAYDDLVIVGAPLRQGVVVPLRLGTKIDLQLKVKDTVREGRFLNQGLIEKRFTAHLPLLQVRVIGTWEKVQERSFLRVPISIDAVFVFHDLGGEESPPQSGVLLDLSGGGFLLRTSKSLGLDDEIFITFGLKEETIRAHAAVSRLIPTDQGVDYGMSFLDLPEQSRQAIIKFVFQRQITLAEIMGKNPK